MKKKVGCSITLIFKIFEPILFSSTIIELVYLIRSGGENSMARNLCIELYFSSFCTEMDNLKIIKIISKSHQTSRKFLGEL